MPPAEPHLEVDDAEFRRMEQLDVDQSELQRMDRSAAEWLATQS